MSLLVIDRSCEARSLAGAGLGWQRGAGPGISMSTGNPELALDLGHRRTINIIHKRRSLFGINLFY